MNGRALEPEHGFPLRLIVPGWYGMASVKWLTEIELVAEPFEGFRQGRRIGSLGQNRPTSSWSGWAPTSGPEPRSRDCQKRE
jgi:DMSO/TMAO reductase YedYZ molybdopterin-dependent catalytic subunit